MAIDLEYVGLGLFYEDLKIGRKFRTVGRTITEADLVAFINCTGLTEVLSTGIVTRWIAASVAPADHRGLG